MTGGAAPLALAVAWASVLAAALVASRPRRRIPIDGGSGAPPALRAGPLTTLGAAVRRLLERLVGGRSPTTPRPLPDGDGRPSRHPGAPTRRGDTDGRDPDGDVWIGAAAVGALVLLAMAPVLVPLPVVAGAVGPRLARRRAAEADRRAWAEALPDAVDLLALGLGSGLSVAPALALAAPRTPDPLGPALDRAHARVVHGASLAEALEGVGDAGPASRPLIALLVAADRDGAPIAEPLTRLAVDLRADRRRAVEARARQVPIRLLFPLVLCSLPAFVLLAIVPPVVAALTDLRR